MTIHKSLKASDVLKRQRNVMSRWERIQTMREGDKWDDGRSVYGIPKTRIQVQRKRVKAKKETTEEGEEKGKAAPKA